MNGPHAARSDPAKTSGNTDTTTGNFLFHIAHLSGDWRYQFGADRLYGATKGETAAQAWDAHLQLNTNITERLYWFGGLASSMTSSQASPISKSSRAAPATSSSRPTPPSSPPRSASAHGGCARNCW